MASPWWRHFPGRLRAELKALRAAGFGYRVNKDAFKEGHLEVFISVNHGDRNYSLRVEFPDTYPYFEPNVYAEDAIFPLHQNPFSGNLCLLPRKTENWWTQWTLAEILQERFPKIIASNLQPRENTRDIEIDQGEPLSTFYSTEPTSFLLVDGNWELPKDVAEGWLRVRLDSSGAVLKGAVIRVEDFNHNVLCNLENKIAAHFPTEIWARWVRVPQFVRENNPDRFYESISASNTRFAKPFWGHKSSTWIDLTGVIFPEEVRRVELRDSWIFVRKTATPPAKGRPLDKPKRIDASFIQAQRCGIDEFYSRIPDLAFARNKRITVCGLGCVGAALALELAKAGFQLTLVDGDEVEIGPTVRWPLGLEYVGLRKAEAMAKFIAQQWPYTEVRGEIHRVGRDRDRDEALLEGADLLIDCTAEFGVQRYLGDLAAARQIPMVMLSSTAGGWGGRVAYFSPSRNTGLCPICLWLYEKEGVFTSPPSDPHGEFQPVGCGDISFHGNSADISEISFAGVRLAFGTISDGSEASYPKCWWNVATISLRSKDGQLIDPKFETWNQPPHLKCPNHLNEL